MFKKLSFAMFLVLLFSLGVTAALADETDLDLDYPWREHAAPFDHLFGNMIDGHQQSQVLYGGQLKGFIYVEYTGDVTEAGLPVAKKVNCASGNRSVGWVVKGVPISATLVNQSPRIWLVDPADLPNKQGYTHFHWTGTPQKPHGLVVGQEYPGYLMKRVAPTPFFWLGGGRDHAGGGSGSCGGETGGCGDDHSASTVSDVGCGDETSGCTDDDGGCTDDDGGCTDDDGGCTHDDGGCTDDDGGCSGGGGSGGSGHGGHSGRIVPEGVDPHTNITTTWDGSWSGCGGCSGGGCGDH